jgi:single-strand DNA-binding protein
MINNVVLVGRITKDLELRYTTSNKETTSFTVAINRAFKGQDGQTQADFISCVAFGKTAINLCRYCGKGSLIGVEGRIQTRNFQGKDGNTVYVTEVIADRVQFLESKNQSQQGQQAHFNNNFNQQNNGFNQGFGNQSQNNFNQQQMEFNNTGLRNNNTMFDDFGNNFPSSIDDVIGDIVNPFKEE